MIDIMALGLTLQDNFTEFVNDNESPFLPLHILYQDKELSCIHYCLLGLYTSLFFFVGFYIHRLGVTDTYSTLYRRGNLPSWVLPLHVATMSFSMLTCMANLLMSTTGTWVRASSIAVALLGLPTMALLAFQCSGPKNAMLAVWAVVGTCVAALCVLTVFAPSPLPKSLPWAWVMVLNGFTLNRFLLSAAMTTMALQPPIVQKWSMFWYACASFALNGYLAVQGNAYLLAAPSLFLVVTVALFEKMDVQNVAHAASSSSNWSLLASESDKQVRNQDPRVKRYAMATRANSVFVLGRGESWFGSKRFSHADKVE